MATRKLAVTADIAVSKNRGVLRRIIITTAMSAAVSTVYDHASAASGTVLFVIAASAPAGTIYEFGDGIPFDLGCFVDIGGTGTALFCFD